MKPKTITVKVKDVSKHMYLRVYLGDAKIDDGRTVEICMLNNGSLHFEIENKSYLIDIENVLQGIIAQHDQKKVKS
jgi:hypothetical protein